MSSATKTAPTFDVARVRRDFPILEQEINGRPLVYLDSAASAQRPTAVIDAVCDLYREDYSNIHRGVHELSMRSTRLYEDVRGTVQRFLNAPSSKSIVFVRGTTEGINLVAQTFVADRVQAGDEILVTAMEHHSNIVPWQMLCERTGAKLVVAPIDEDGDVVMSEYSKLLGKRTKFVATCHVSNALGTVNPAKEMIRLAHEKDIPVLLDGAQAVPHQAVDVQDLDVDFYVFSGHKVYAPSGIGALYGRPELLEAMRPWQGGGDMIMSVEFDATEYNEVPHKFEAGTPNIAGTVGLGVALDYVTNVGIDAVAAHEHDLLVHATEALEKIDGVRIVGRAKEKAGVVSFVMDDVHPHDIGTILDREGVAIRAGHHCAQPVMTRYGIAATARASFGMYNTTDDIDRLVDAIVKVKEIFGV